MVLDGRVLGGEAKGVEAHGVQHVIAAHTGLARHGVADGVVARVAHVEVARRVREHLEDVLLGLGGVLVGLVELLVFPGLLPLGLYGLRVVGRHLEVILLSAVAHVKPLLAPLHSLSILAGIPVRGRDAEPAGHTAETVPWRERTRGGAEPAVGR